MSSPMVAFLCIKLSHDADAGVREIARRCLGAYTEFTGMKYAQLTARDEERLLSSARAARAAADSTRATLLEEGGEMIGKVLRPQVQPSAKTKPRTAAGRVRRGAGKAPSSTGPSA